MLDNQLSLAQASLKHRLDEVPTELKPHIRMGFSLIGRADRDARESFFRYVIEGFAGQKSIESKDASELLSLDDNTISDALSAASLAIGATTDLAVTEDDFVTFGRGTVFDSDDEGVVRELLSIALADRDNLQASMRENSLANSVLPSFRNLSYKVDIRLGFDDAGENVESTVPVALFYLSTDTAEELWFQATTDGVRRLRERLERVEKSLEQAKLLSRGLRDGRD